METHGCNLCLLPLSCSSSLVSSHKELIPLSGALTFVAAARRHLCITWFCWPVGFMLQESYNWNQGERVHKLLPPLGHGRRQQTQEVCLSHRKWERPIGLSL